MLESIVVRQTSHNEPLIDPGLLAECLLFYDKVHLLLQPGGLASLLTTLGPDQLIAMVERPNVRVSFLRQMFGTRSESIGGVKVHNFVVMSHTATEGKGRMSPRDHIELLFERSLGPSRSTGRLAKKFNAKTKVATLDERGMTTADLGQAALSDVADNSFVRGAIRVALRELAPGYQLPSEWTFRVFRADEGLVIDTNLNFEALNAEYRKRVAPTHSALTPEFLLNYIWESRGSAFLVSKYLSEFVNGPVSTGIIKLRFTELVRKRENSVQELDLFQEVHLPGSRSLRGAINSGDRSFQEFLELLDKAERFKTWLAGRNPDAGLLAEYHDEVTRLSWMEKLPVKTARWVLATGLGAAIDAVYGTAAGLGVSIADAFLIDKITRGWRPNQFVEGPLTEFVNTPP